MVKVMLIVFDELRAFDILAEFDGDRVGRTISLIDGVLDNVGVFVDDILIVSELDEDKPTLIELVRESELDGVPEFVVDIAGVPVDVGDSNIVLDGVSGRAPDGEEVRLLLGKGELVLVPLLEGNIVDNGVAEIVGVKTGKQFTIDVEVNGCASISEIEYENASPFPASIEPPLTSILIPEKSIVLITPPPPEPPGEATDSPFAFILKVNPVSISLV